MIYIADRAVAPKYARTILSRTGIRAEICVYTRGVPTVACGAKIYHTDYGTLLVDSTVLQGEYMLLRASDPLTHISQHTVCMAGINPGTGAGSKTMHDNAQNIMHDIIIDQLRSDIRDNLGIDVQQPAHYGSADIAIDIRLDKLSDVISAIAAKDESFFLDVRSSTTKPGAIAYTPDIGSSEQIPVYAPSSIDYGHMVIVPTSAVVAGKVTERVGRKIRENFKDTDPLHMYQTFVNAPQFSSEYDLDTIGERARDEGRISSDTVVIRMHANNVPETLLPADMVYLPSLHRQYRVQAIEIATSPKADIAYITCGGLPVSISDRINALVAQDYASRV